MAKRGVPYALVNAFTIIPFNGNPAGVCLLEEGVEVDDHWMHGVAAELKVPVTAFLTPAGGLASASSIARFHLRWFTAIAEVEVCGHATLATAHYLFESGAVEGEKIEFETKFGHLTAKKLQKLTNLDSLDVRTNDGEKNYSIELDFPSRELVDCESTDIPSIPKTLDGLSIVNVQKIKVPFDLIVELASGKDLADINPNFDELERCPGRGVVITAPAPPGSGFDFFTRFFCPKLGVNEDFVCASAHCALAPYWSKKLGKHNFIAYQASPRGGVLDLELTEKGKRVLIRGPAVTVMTGSILV